MYTLTVPKEVTKGETLIIIPKKEYDDFLNFRKKQQATSIRKTLNQDLDEALDDVKHGRTIGPFTDLKEGLNELKNG